MSTLVKTATVFGGTGFIGRQIVRELAAKGVLVKVATRVPERAYFLKPCGAVGQVTAVACDYRDPQSIEHAVKGSDFVVNTIGLLFQTPRSRFDAAHIEIPEEIAKACKAQGVKRFIHISGLGVEGMNSQYGYTKREGDKAVMKAFKNTTILRPSLVFGPDDDFFNKFAALALVMPFLPLIGGGQTKFQPVYVGDVAKAAINLLYAGEDMQGKTYELGGPEISTFGELLEMMFKYTGVKRTLVKLPSCVAKFIAGGLSIIPMKPLLTVDQVRSLKTDSVVSGKEAGFAELGIAPTALEMILPTYLETHKAGGRFAHKKTAS